MEDGIAAPAGQPTMGQRAGKAYFFPAIINYQAVPALSTATALTGGGGGAIGDYLEGILVTPTNSNVGAISIKDGGGPVITVFNGGGASVADTKPFYLPVRARSSSGGWSIATSNNASVLASGAFT